MFQQVVLCCDDQELGIRKKKKKHWDIFSPLRLNKGTPLLYFSARQEMDVASFGLNMEYKLSGMIKGMMRKEGMCECVSVWGRLTEVGLFEVKCFLKSWGFYFCLSVGLFFLLLIPAAHAVPCSMMAVYVCVCGTCEMLVCGMVVQCMYGLHCMSARYVGQWVCSCHMITWKHRHTHAVWSAV